MKTVYYWLYSKITGKHHVNSPVNFIKNELLEKRALPTGLAEFHEWSERIISGAMLPADIESQKYALANDLMHCPPNMAYETDVYFIHRLRKYAVNQVADQVRKDLYAARKARDDAKKEEQNQSEVTPPENNEDGKVLGIKRVQEVTG